MRLKRLHLSVLHVVVSLLGCAFQKVASVCAACCWCGGAQLFLDVPGVIWTPAAVSGDNMRVSEQTPSCCFWSIQLLYVLVLCNDKTLGSQRSIFIGSVRDALYSNDHYDAPLRAAYRRMCFNTKLRRSVKILCGVCLHVLHSCCWFAQCTWCLQL